MSRLPVLLTTGVLAAALGAGALGVASAAAPAPTTSPEPSASPAKAGPHPTKGLMRRVAHGEFVVRQKGGFTTIAVQRGRITAVSATSITVASQDGYVRSYVVNADTKVRSKGTTVAVGALKAGEQAMIRSTKTGTTYTATRVAGLRAKAAASTAPAPQGSTSG